MHDPDGKEKQKALNSVILIPQKDKKNVGNTTIAPKYY